MQLTIGIKFEHGSQEFVGAEGREEGVALKGGGGSENRINIGSRGQKINTNAVAKIVHGKF